MKDLGGDQVAQTCYGMPLGGEKKKVRCHLLNCILMHAKVAIVSGKRVQDKNNSAPTCYRAQNCVKVDAPCERACPTT